MSNETSSDAEQPTAAGFFSGTTKLLATVAAFLASLASVLGVATGFFQGDDDPSSNGAAVTTQSAAGGAQATATPAANCASSNPKAPTVVLAPLKLDAAAPTPASVDAGPKEYTILFENHTGAERRIRWINWDGRPEENFRVLPGGTHEMTTYAGHVWEIADADEKRLEVYRMEPTDSLVLLC
jgi:hypothetical protein